MNILPHKSWNVWSTKNIARVERDEARAAEEEREREKARVAANSERRIEVLKSRTGTRKKEESQAGFRLFEEEERRAKLENPEVVRQRKRRSEKVADEAREYLGGKSRGQEPWYSSQGSKQDHLTGRKKKEDDWLKRTEDPVPPKPARSERKKRHREIAADTAADPGKDSDKGGMSTIERLRMERKKRETNEQRKIQALLESKRPSKRPRTQDDRSRDYNEGYTSYSGGKRRDYRRH